MIRTGGHTLLSRDELRCRPKSKGLQPRGQHSEYLKVCCDGIDENADKRKAKDKSKEEEEEKQYHREEIAKLNAK